MSELFWLVFAWAVLVEARLWSNYRAQASTKDLALQTSEDLRAVETETSTLGCIIAKSEIMERAGTNGDE